MCEYSLEVKFIVWLLVANKFIPDFSSFPETFYLKLY